MKWDQKIVNYIQATSAAKETLEWNSNKWNKMWSNFLLSKRGRLR